MRLDALVIDIQVLGPQGWPYLEAVCARLPRIAVLVCTGPSTVAQRVRALRLGADDWIGKPCHADELLARVEAVVRRRRRQQAPEAGKPVMAGDLEIRADKFQVLAGSVAVDLTRREFELIGVLVEAQAQVLRREEIYERVWGYAMVHGDRSVDVFVRKLRQKLERVSPGWLYIHTHFGIGYRFAHEPVDAVSLPAPADTSAEPTTLGEPVGA
jgi:DNA-binding response OmpR family regulator